MDGGRQIYAGAAESWGSHQPQQFMASEGWINKSMIRYKTKSAKASSEAASAGRVAARQCPEALEHVITEAGVHQTRLLTCMETTTSGNTCQAEHS